MRRTVSFAFAISVVVSLLTIIGCGLSGPELATKNLVDSVVEMNNGELLQSCTEDTKNFIEYGFTKDIYGGNLPLDYLTNILGDKNLQSVEIQTKETKGPSAITTVKVKGEDNPAYLFLQKDGEEWLFDMQKTITLSKASAKDRTLAWGEKAETTFSQEDYPTQVGTEIRYFTNKPFDDNLNPLPPVPVSFNLEGPWDFSEGPTENEVVKTVVERGQSPDAANFPDSKLVERIDGGTLGHVDAYYSNDPDGLKVWGSAGHAFISKVAGVSTFNPPWFELKYPLKKGMEWQDSYQNIESGFGAEAPFNMNRFHKVVAINQIKTPYKSYEDCILVQTRVETLKPAGTVTRYNYGWYVQGVGMVVGVSSVDGETNEVFTQTGRFYRLKYFGQEKPAGMPQ